MFVIKKYLKKRIKMIILFFSFSIVFLAVFSLYSLPLEPVFYSYLLCFCLAFVVMLIDFYFHYKKHHVLNQIQKNIIAEIDSLPHCSDLIDEDYQGLIKTLFNRCEELSSSFELSKKNMLDYYTMWVHQIKTPIAALDLLLQSGQDPQAKELKTELFKIEQYVEMVLSYLRLESDTTDYKIKSYPIDDIIKKALRKYSAIFIGKKINLIYDDLGFNILTDEKWLLFVIEQIISNSLKYTMSGSITITSENPKILVIKDTGIGISKEDLPRIFEKGYVGYNGRIEQRSTGIGLYICKKIIKKLSHSIVITSTVSVGTEVRIYLDNYKQIME